MSLYTVDTIPDETDSTPGGELTCENCGRQFDHTGRGRKPKNCPECRANSRTTMRTNTTRKSTKDVEAACAVLESAYSAVALGLLMLSPRAAETWAHQVDTLQAQNKLTLAGDPMLCKSILRAGEKTGKAAFLISHVLAVAPVAMAIRQDMPKRKPKPNMPKQPKPKQPRVAETPEQFAEWERDMDTNIPAPVDKALRFFE